jgi:hypothetical protein
MEIATNSPTQIDGLRRNCTLVAVRDVTGADDLTIIKEFLARGWKPHRGAHEYQYMGVVRALGFTVEEVDTYLQCRGHIRGWRRRAACYMSLGVFCRTFKEGAYVVHNRYHAFVIRDGHVVDPNFGNKRMMRRRIVGAFRVLNAAPSRHVDVEARKLRRNSDPMVSFAARSVRRKGTKSWRIEMNALLYAHNKGGVVLLSDLTKAVPEYTRSFAAWDIQRGRLVANG